MSFGQLPVISFLLLNLLLSTGCTRSEWVASVGNQRISKNDVSLRLEMIRLLNPKATKTEALDQLINYKIGNEILEATGNRISQRDISGELEQIKKEAVRNPKLSSLLRAYQRNHSFSELFLYPRIVESKVLNLYENDKPFHEKDFTTASTLLNRTKADPSNFETITKEMGFPFFQGSIDSKDGALTWDMARGLASDKPKLPQESWFGQKLRNEYLNKMGTNQVFSEPIPFWFGYLILRKDPAEKNLIKFSASVTPRPGQWFWIKQKSFFVPVTRFDQTI